jgi:hypothetical protein
MAMRPYQRVFLNGKIDNKPNAYIIPFHTKGRRERRVREREISRQGGEERRERETSEGKRDKQARGRGKERERDE